MNSIIKTGTLFFVLLFNLCSAYSQEVNKDVTIISSGQGKTLEDAKQSALRSATEQAFGAFISSKTEMFNDQVVADQMASVSSGNIKSFDIMNQDQLPDGRWGVTLKAIVSVDKLTSFVQAKGVVVEVKGGLFALNIKQQLLNEQGEIKAVAEMIGLLHEPMQISFDYVIKSSDPKSLNDDSKKWEIPIIVTATCNKNIEFCANYLKKTLSAISLSANEINTYKNLNKKTFGVKVFYKGQSSTFYLRKQASILAIESLVTNWEFYTRLFTVKTGIDESNGNGNVQLFEFSKSNRYTPLDDGVENEFHTLIPAIEIKFPSNAQKVAIFSWNDERTLDQLEHISQFSVIPRGVVSNFKNGGYILYEKNGHGIVKSLFDLGVSSWRNAKTACEELVLNGYDDWRLPTKEELELIYNNHFKNYMFCNMLPVTYWSSTEKGNDYIWYFSFKSGSVEYGGYGDAGNTWQVRAVRTF